YQAKQDRCSWIHHTLLHLCCGPFLSISSVSLRSHSTFARQSVSGGLNSFSTRRAMSCQNPGFLPSVIGDFPTWFMPRSGAKDAYSFALASRMLSHFITAIDHMVS